MHTVFMTRGILGDTISFINELSTKYLPYPYYNKETKKMENRHLQMRVSPIMLWDVSFPKEQANVVLNTIYVNGGEPMNPKHKKYIKLVKKAMGLKELPKLKKDVHLAMQLPKNLEIIGIGVKDDYWITEEGKHVNEKDKTKFSYEGI